MEGLPYALPFASVWSLEYAGTILSEIPRLSPPPTFPVSRILSLRDETHCSVMWWDLTVILRLIVHCARSRRLEPVPALTPAGADAQAARATRGYSRSATVLLSAPAPNGLRPTVVGIPSWRNDLCNPMMMMLHMGHGRNDEILVVNRIWIFQRNFLFEFDLHARAPAVWLVRRSSNSR